MIAKMPYYILSVYELQSEPQHTRQFNLDPYTIVRRIMIIVNDTN